MVVPTVNGEAEPLKPSEVSDPVNGGSEEYTSLREKISSNVEASQLAASLRSEPLASYPKSRFTLLDHFVDEPRPLKVAVIGGGLSGILAGILLPTKVPGIQLTIYEKNKDFVSKTVLVNLLGLINN